MADRIDELRRPTDPSGDDAQTSAGTPIDVEKLRSIAVIGRRTGSRVQEGRDSAGQRFKATTDELGNTVTQRAGDRQDVTIRPQAVRLKTHRSG